MPRRSSGWETYLENENTISILLADAHSLFRQAVKAVLQNEEEFRVVAEAGEGLEAVAEAERTQPHVAFLGTNLSNGSGVSAAAMITKRVPGCRVALLTDEEDPATLIEAVEAGASGYLTKESPVAELIEATRAIHRGETLIPQRMLGSLLERLIRRRREQDEAQKRTSRLTNRERSVLALLAEGADNDAIAQALVISPQTARTHIHNVLGKLGVHSRLEAVAFVRQNGILEDLVAADG